MSLGGKIYVGILIQIILVISCRENSPYYSTDRFQSTYTIKKLWLADLLVHRYTKECGNMEYANYYKMSIWGALSYLIYLLGFIPYMITWVLFMMQDKYDIIFYPICFLLLILTLVFGMLSLYSRRSGLKRSI